MKFLTSSLLALAVLVSSVSADIALTTTSGLSFVQNSGNQNFQLFAQGGVADPSVIAMIATIKIASPTPGVGIFTSPISYSSNFNAPNVNGSSSGVIDPLDARISYLSLDFTAPQAIPSMTPGVFGTFTFNVNGLLPGIYNIDFEQASTDGPLINGGLDGTAGSFEITAVPEPTSILTTATLGFAGLFYRRRRSVRAA
jgi:hypothetical protein